MIVLKQDLNIKSYYEDRDLKPTEDLLLTLTISPITSYEHKIDQDLFRD